MIPAWAGAYYRIPYADLNCRDLVQRVLREQAGLELPAAAHEFDRLEDLAWVQDVRPIVLNETESWKPVEAGLPQLFDVALYSVDGGCHIGVVLDWHHGLMTDRQHGAHPYRLGMSFWVQKLEGYWRHVSLAAAT